MMHRTQLRPSAIVFDFDGTIANTLPSIVVCYRAMYARLGGPAPTDEQVIATIGLPLETAIKIQSGFDDERVAVAVGIYRDVFGELDLSTVEAFAGMPEVVEWCRDAGLPTAVASSRSHSSLDPMLRALRLFDRMQLVVDHTDAGHEKPHPAMLLLIARSLGVAPEDMVMIGDTTFDIEMGHAAGCPTIGVSWGSHSRATLEAAKPSFLVDSPAEILRVIALPDPAR